MASEHGFDALSGRARTPASAPPGALDNDPLTSPSFAAIPSTDSRSYGPARKHAAPAPASPPATGTGRENGYRGQHGEDYLGTGYEDQPGAPAPATPTGGWYAAPGQRQTIPAYGNPYGDPVSPAAVARQPGPANGYAAVDYRDYASGHSSGYARPAYQAPGTEPHAGLSSVPFPGQQPYGDSPLAAQPFPEGYASTGYAPGYEGRGAADPYGAGGYDGYPARG